MIHLEVDRVDFRRTRLVDSPDPPVPEDGVRLRIERLAMTSNNITYAAMGEGELGYFDFFPTVAGWGRPPAWGFAVVQESNVEAVRPGERVYGYFPLATHLDITPARATPHTFFDAAPHRQGKAAVYNQYLLTGADPVHVPGRENELALFRPLYATGWWAADFVRERCQGARTAIVSSASAKTAVAMAHELRTRAFGNVIALTSPRNLDYLRSIGLHDTVLTYQQVADAEPEAPAVFADFLGREALTAELHARFGRMMARSIMIGATDWTAKPGGIRVPEAAFAGPRPEFFFVPGYAAERCREQPSLRSEMVSDLRAFVSLSSAFVEPVELIGPDQIARCWDRLAEGEVAPREGLIVLPNGS